MEEIKSIKERNRKVELDKAWETSLTRRGIITIITYVIAVAFMYQIGISDAVLNAFVPTGGYVLSTLSLPFIKRLWIKSKSK